MELLRTSAESLWRRRKQLSLTVCGIAIGVFSVLVISAIGAAGQSILGAELEKLGFDCITVSASQGELNTLTGDDLAAVKALDGVEVAAPLNSCIGRVTMRDYAGEALVCGVDQNAGTIIDLELKNGRLLRESDVSSGASCCVIDENLAYAFYRRTNIVGKQMEVTVNQSTETFTIVGVVDGESNALKNLAGDYVPSFVYIPYTAHQSLTKSSVIDQLFVKVSEGTTPEEAGEEIVTLLNRSAGYRNLYRYNDLAVQKERLESILGGVTLVLSAIGGISLVVSGLSIMTTMTVAVRERTKEIGVKKAVGAKTFHILREFMTESILLTAAGSFLGILVSGLLTLAAGQITGLGFLLKPRIIAAVIFFSVGIGAVFGVYPARTASRLRPVDALRHE